MTRQLRILIADDHAITRFGIASLLETEEDFMIVAQAEDGDCAIREAERTQPDVVIMDLMMPKVDGLEATRRILEKVPLAKILILTTFGSADSIAHALNAGATGAIMKNAEIASFPDIIRSIANGQRVIDPEIKKMLDHNPPIPTLTERQRIILESLARGLSNKEIATQLSITANSVKDHINTIFSKIGAATRAEAVSIAIQRHLLKM